ncbi:MAG: hypothetical protein NVS1B13_05890 [Flavisolibacter sp.]
MKFCYFIIVFITISILGFSQDSTKNGSSSISINFSGVPVQQISGIDTSFKNDLSISPVLDLRTNSGWGVSYSPSIVTSAVKSGLYMHSITAGYEQYGKHNMDLVFNYNHYIFTNKTSVPFSPINNELFFSIAYSKNWIKPVFSLSYGFGKDSANVAVHDIGLVAGLSHGFNWEDKGIFSNIDITPSILLNAGTNGYFSFLHASKYLSRSSNFARYVKKGGGGSGRKRQTSTSPSFDLSNIELNMETSFEMGSFSINPSGSLFFPMSSGTDNSTYGYAQVSLKYHF